VLPDRSNSPSAPDEPGLRRLAANLAHNLNNTLTGAIGYLELALRELPAHSSAREYLSHSMLCSLRVAEMVRRIVAFAFHPTGKGEWSLVSLRQVAEHLGRSLHEQQPNADFRVVVHAEAEGLIRASNPLLLLIMEQLVSNALEAMPQGGTLTLQVWDEGPSRCLRVSDTGCGMSPEVRARLFEPFFTTKFSGHLGLGLALSRDVVEALGGVIRLTSIEGQGTTVTLSFPPAEQSRLEELPIDERIGLLVSSPLRRYPGPHFPRPAVTPTDPPISASSYSI
jgi:signal transduction histidine kinase